MSRLDVPAWTTQAICPTLDLDLFFPDTGHSDQGAKKVCAGCPVRLSCLDYALEHEANGGVAWGVWGGLNAAERRRVRRPRRCLDCDAIIPAGRGAPWRCETHRAEARQASKRASEERRRAA